ncbi:unnamed protein product [Symbiodinium sp. KB8]|nr:unnamed protein product [Symbiodinium sp. KB8]
MKRTVYVGGLDEQVDRKVLEEAFVKFGDLKTVEIPLDMKTGKHRGFGFVEFMEVDDAEAAIDNMHSAELYGRTIKVNLARAPKNTPTTESNRPIWADDFFYRKKLKGPAQDWAACVQSREWSAFRHQVRATFEAGAETLAVGRDLARKARVLLQRWQVPAGQWRAMLGSARPAGAGGDLEEAHCGTSVDVTRGVLAQDTSRGFHPYHLLTLPHDSPAWRQEDFLRWQRDFCYLGYVVALYVRSASRIGGSKALQEEEKVKLSKEDLQTASSMLGRCREMDFLDRSVWGLQSLDLDVSLLRLADQGAQGAVAAVAPWRGLAEDFPREHRNARQNLWQALGNGAKFRRSLEAQVARSVASGSLTGWHSPKPHWRRRPIDVALFAVPVWYATEFLVGILRWRFPALPLSVFCAPLGGYNLPRSNELRDLVEPLLQEPAELQVLRLIEGYCCNWEQVDFLVVRVALNQLARRLARSSFSLLVCAGPLWLCLLLREEGLDLPLLAHCLTFQDLDYPGDKDQNVAAVAWVHRKILENFGAAPGGSGTRVSGVLVQDDMQRVYYPMIFDFTRQGNFSHAGQLSFFQMPYIQARYTQRRLRATRPDADELSKEVVIVREGTTKRWTLSLRGHLWYLKLKQMAAAQTERELRCCQLRFLKDEVARIPYSEIAEHRAAVFFPGIGHAKLTLHELRTMGIPTLFPAKSLMYRVEDLILDPLRRLWLAAGRGGNALHGSVDFVIVWMAAPRLLHGMVQLLPLPLFFAFRETPGSKVCQWLFCIPFALILLPMPLLTSAANLRDQHNGRLPSLNLNTGCRHELFASHLQT